MDFEAQLDDRIRALREAVKALRAADDWDAEGEAERSVSAAAEALIEAIPGMLAHEPGKGAHTVFAVTPDGAPCSVGPVNSPESLERLRARVEKAGWPTGTAMRHYSQAGFIQLIGQAEAAGS